LIDIFSADTEAKMRRFDFPQELQNGWSDELADPIYAEYEDSPYMCFKKGGSAPAAPDPQATAAAQAAANKDAVRESAKVNQINQVTPYGNTTFSGDIGSPDRTQTLTLPDELQGAVSNQQKLQNYLSGFAADYAPQVAQSMSTPFNTANLGVSAPSYDDSTRARIEQSLYDRIEPQFAKDEDRLRTQLANQGIGVGSEAYGDSMEGFNDAKTNARLAVTQQAGNEAARDFSLQQQGFNQALSNELLNRTQGLNEVSALTQGTGALQTPGLAQPAQYQVASPDIIGLEGMAYQGRLNNYNQQMGQQNAAMGGLAGLGAAGIGLLSDIRAKTDIKKVGSLDNGLGVYTFKYKTGGPVQMGVMAQEVEKVDPSAVFDFGGVKMVDYGRL